MAKQIQTHNMEYENFILDRKIRKCNERRKDWHFDFFFHI